MKKEGILLVVSENDPLTNDTERWLVAMRILSATSDVLKKHIVTLSLRKRSRRMFLGEMNFDCNKWRSTKAFDHGHCSEIMLVVQCLG
jgi:hypothetical protein